MNLRNKLGLSGLILSLTFLSFTALSCSALFRGASPAPQTISTSISSTAVQITVGEATVTRVIDGDTIDASISGKIYRIRYIVMNTPEVGKPFYQEATDKNAELVQGKTVRLVKDVSETDKYGRLLRYVYVGDLFVNAEMVRQGYAPATPYPPDIKYKSYFLSLEKQAQAAHLGLWLSTTP